MAKNHAHRPNGGQQIKLLVDTYGGGPKKDGGGGIAGAVEMKGKVSALKQACKIIGMLPDSAIIQMGIKYLNGDDEPKPPMLT